jgi:hypothetical protein
MAEIIDPTQRLHPFGVYRGGGPKERARLLRYRNSRILLPASTWVAVHRYAGPDRYAARP